MKLTKAKLNKILKPSLEGLGYIWFKDTISQFQGLYVKKVFSDLFLTLGINISRYYDNSFTGDFYLSKTTRIGSVWGDIPEKSYQRVGSLLTEDELKNYMVDGTIIKDIWWNNLITASVDDFIFRVKQCEHRICNDVVLREQIEKSIEVNKLHEYALKVIENVDTIPNRCNYLFIPSKEIDDIPMKWFMAAEEVLSSSNSIVNKNTVKDLASDSFIQFKLLNKDGLF